MGLFGVLGIVFIVLKLVGVIHWSWWWMLLPLYRPVVLIAFPLGVVFAGIWIKKLINESTRSALESVHPDKSNK